MPVFTFNNQERRTGMEHSDSIIKLSAALCKAQKNFKTAIKKSKNPYFKSNYANYTEILQCVKEPLNNEGISILQPIKDDIVETILLHESGEYILSQTRIYNLSNKPQDYGSAITYARRYALSAILSIDSDEDDDGNIANGNNNNNTINNIILTPIVQNQPIKKEVTDNGINDTLRIFDLRKRIANLYKKGFSQDFIEKHLGFSLKEIPAKFEIAQIKVTELEQMKKEDK